MVLQETMSKSLQRREIWCILGLFGGISVLAPLLDRMRGEAAQVLLNMFVKKDLGVR